MLPRSCGDSCILGQFTIRLKGLSAPPSGCYFHPRCNYAKDICKTQEPSWQEVDAGHFSLCHFAKELSLRGADIQAGDGDAGSRDDTLQLPVKSDYKSKVKT